MLVLVIAAVLAAYNAEIDSSFSYNFQFQTAVYGRGESRYCALTTAPGSTSNGIDYRFAIAFGAKNEIRLVTDEALTDLTRIRIRFGGRPDFKFTPVRQESVGQNRAAFVKVSRPVISRVLVALRRGDGTVILDLPLGSPRFDLPKVNRAGALQGVRECEDALSARVG